jgi:hypothetical protein
MNYPKRLIKKGESKKAIVKAVQQRLLECNCGPIDDQPGIFGARTEQSVKLFQSLHRDKNDLPLVIDGKIGAFTWEALFGPDTVPVNDVPAGEYLSKALEVARLQVGVLEEPLGSNRGPMVDKYLASVGLNPGLFWCMAFVYWTFNEAAIQLNRRNPLVKTGGVLRQWNETTAKKVLKNDAVNNPNVVKPGQIFIIDHGGGKGHTGIVTAVEGGNIRTIEGNSNTTGSRNGIGVVELVRKINSINKGFIECK